MLKSDQNNQISTTIASIIDPFFDEYIEKLILGTIESWGRREYGETSPGGLKDAIDILYAATNLSQGKFEEKLKSFYQDPTEINAAHQQFGNLNMICNGQIKDDDKVESGKQMFTQCEKLSTVKGDNLKKLMGGYIKEKSNNLLKQKQPNIYREFEKMHQANQQNAAIGIIY